MLTATASAFVIARATEPEMFTVADIDLLILRATVPDTLTVAESTFEKVNDLPTVPEMLTAADRAFAIARPTVPDRLTVPTSDLLTARATEPEVLTMAEIAL